MNFTFREGGRRSRRWSVRSKGARRHGGETRFLLVQRRNAAGHAASNALDTRVIGHADTCGPNSED